MLAANRDEIDGSLRTVNETQRQVNDCLQYKRNKQSEEDLGRHIDKISAQMGQVCTHCRF